MTNSNRRARRGVSRTGRVPSAVLLLIAAGCGPPQVEPEHRELVLRLATATSTQDLAMLESAGAELDRIRDSGEAGDTPIAAFEAIVRLGREGDWDGAQRRAYALRDAQRPTAEDVERIRSRTLPPMKTPGAAGNGS